jgi:hypothetical protein
MRIFAAGPETTTIQDTMRPVKGLDEPFFDLLPKTKLDRKIDAALTITTTLWAKCKLANCHRLHKVEQTHCLRVQRQDPFLLALKELSPTWV